MNATFTDWAVILTARGNGRNVVVRHCVNARQAARTAQRRFPGFTAVYVQRFSKDGNA